MKAWKVFQKNITLGLTLVILTISVVSYLGANALGYYTLNHDEIADYIKAHVGDKEAECRIVDEKDLDNNHIIFYAIQGKDGRELFGAVSTERTGDNRYRSLLFLPGPVTSPGTAILTTQDGKKEEHHYGVVFGKLSAGQPRQYVITCNGEEYEESFASEEFFIKIYEISNGVLSMGLHEAS